MMVNAWGEQILDLYRFAWMFAMVAWPLMWFAALSSYKYALGPDVSAAWTRRWRVWLSLASFLVGWFLIGFRLDSIVPGGMSLTRALQSSQVVERAFEHPMDVAIIVAQLWCAGLLAVLGGVLVVKFYEKWMNGRLSEAEQRPGREGVRAWIGGWNLVLVVGIALCAWLGYGNGPLVFVAVLVMGEMSVLAYPMLMTGTGAAPGASAADLTPERERVLRMLEEGKVTAEEAAELLSALGHTLPPAAVVEPWTPGRKLTMVGAAVVLVGFFLPWFSFNAVAEMRQMMNQGAASMGINPNVLPGANVTGEGTVVHVAGGDIGHGLGWIMLGLALAAAVTPLVATGLPREQRRVVMLVGLAAGGIIGLYLLTESFAHVDLGLPIVLAGYVVEAVGVLRDQVGWGTVAPFRTTAGVV